jgi:hypothetical protein
MNAVELFKDVLFVAPNVHEVLKDLDALPKTVTLPGEVIIIKCDYLEPNQIAGDPKIIQAIKELQA